MIVLFKVKYQMVSCVIIGQLVAANQGWVKFYLDNHALVLKYGRYENRRQNCLDAMQALSEVAGSPLATDACPL